MKKIIFYAAAAAALLLNACSKGPELKSEMGYLSFADFNITCDDEVVTKAVSPASGNYSVLVYDMEGNLVEKTTYAAVKANDNKLGIPAGEYTLVARSSEDEVPVAEFEQPVYGATTTFSIAAGETTTIGQLTCTLLQCKVTVAYSDEFLQTVTGAGSTKVSIKSGFPLEYALNADGSYEQSAGYFAVDGSTMEVVFSGSINGKTSKMTKAFTGITARQWRQVKFVQKKNEQGEATFEIVINDLVDDETLNNNISSAEDILGEDPEAPKGDGGIDLAFDYAAGCDAQLTDLTAMQIVPLSERHMSIKLRATVPDGVKKFSVGITSTSTPFTLAVEAADATNLDLINPSETNAVIFQVVPFPHGAELVGQTDIAFDLSAAQEAIINYPGVHTFTMKIVDQNNCTKSIPVVMLVD